MNLSIRWKLAGTFLILIVLLLSVTNLLVLHFLEDEYLEGRKTTSLTNANIIAITGRDIILSQDRNAFYLARDFGTQMGVRVLILDSQGSVTVDSFGEEWLEGSIINHNEVVSALAGNSQTGVHENANGEKVLYVAVPVLREKDTAGAVMLVVGLDDIYLSLNELQDQMIAVSLICGLLASLLSLFLSGLLTRPITELTTAVKQMESGKLEQQVSIYRGDELGQLANAFNSMSHSISKLDQSRRRFLSDASHELKSPLSAIKALAQSLIDTDEQDPGVYKEFLQDIDTEIDRLSRLVINMLQLTRLEEGTPFISKEKHDLCLIINHVASLMQAKADNYEIRLRIDCNSPVFWTVNSDLISSIIINLVDNAIRHTPSGGEVIVSTVIEDENLVISVADTGEGVPPEDLPYIFNRFYRVDKARSRGTGGTGLGLSMVQGAVKQLGGTIEVNNYPGKGIVFRIVVP
jgi:signal transduction histidine kinase